MSDEIRRDLLEQVAGPVGDDQAELLDAYRRILLGASGRVNVMSRLQLERFGEHVVDSAAVLKVVDPGGRSCVDLGSGGGLPGIVLAILRPGARMALIEARRNKVVVLKKIERELGLQNLEIVHERIEAVPEASYDLGFSRALGGIEKTLVPSLRVIRDGGRLVLYKGPGWTTEGPAMETIAENEQAELARAIEVSVPGSDRVTTFVEFHVKRGRGER